MRVCVCVRVCVYMRVHACVRVCAPSLTHPTAPYPMQLHIADSLVFVQLLLPVGGADPVDLTDEVYTAGRSHDYHMSVARALGHVSVTPPDVTKIQSMDFVLDKQGKGREVRKGSFDIPQSAQDVCTLGTPSSPGSLVWV